MQNSGSIYGAGLDPEILDILGAAETPREENPALIGIEEQAVNQALQAQRTKVAKSETAVQTAAMDSKGRLLHVGDKVIIGNDKSVGRITALGRYAKVMIPNEGEFEFPCSVLELFGATDANEAINNAYQRSYQQASQLLQPGAGRQLSQPQQPAQSAQPKYEGYQAAPQSHHVGAGEAQYQEAHYKSGKDPKFESYDLTSMMRACAQEEDDFSDIADANSRLSTMFDGQPYHLDIRGQ